jgi:lysophospholipase L1-like esterase
MNKRHNNSIKATIHMAAILTISALIGCTQTPPATPALPSESPTDTPTVTQAPTVSTTPTATEILPQTLVFYGDSSLAIGDAGDELSHVGFSFVTDLEEMLDPSYALILANYGGRTAKWAYEHLEEAVLSYQPDTVTLWWGFDDMGGCPGSFDRDTNQQLMYKVEAIVDGHIHYMELQVDALLNQDIPVIIMTPVPAYNGQLPWSHLDENYVLIWEEGHWCNFNQSLQFLVQAQRDLVADYSNRGEPVFLVDVWQIYMDHPNTEKMYMDVVHPASVGAQLIAEGWLDVYESIQR